MLEQSVQDVRQTEFEASPSPVRTLSRAEMERRRMEAAEDFLHGVSHSQVVAKFGVSRTTASRWHRALNAQGLESLRKSKASGRPSRLTSEQMAQIADACQKGALSMGCSGDHWTAKSLARAIEERFSVHYSLEHVARLLTRFGPARTVKVTSQGEAVEQAGDIARH